MDCVQHGAVRRGRVRLLVTALPVRPSPVSDDRHRRWRARQCHVERLDGGLLPAQHVRDAQVEQFVFAGRGLFVGQM